MDAMIWPGAMVTLLGLVGLVWCVMTVARARKQGLDPDAMKALLQRMVIINMIALFLSVIGLMMVVVGILLG